MEQLESLVITGVYTDRGLKHLRNLKSLRRVQISSPFVTETALETLKKHLPSLQHLRHYRYRRGNMDTSFSEKDGFWRKGSAEDRKDVDPLEGQSPPLLQVAGWMNTGDKPLTLGDYKGKVVLIDICLV